MATVPDGNDISPNRRSSWSAWIRLAVSAETRAGRSPAIAHRMSTSWVARSTRHADVADPGRERTRPAGSRSRRRDRQPAGLEQPAELEDRRVEPLDVADLDGRRARRRCRGDDLVGLGRRRGERLLDEDGDAALDRGQGERQVAGRRSRDDDRVEVRLGQHRHRFRERLGAGSRGRGGQRGRRPGRRWPRGGRRAAPRRTRRWFRPIDPSPISPTRTSRSPTGDQAPVIGAARSARLGVALPGARRRARTAAMTVAWSSSERPGYIGSDRDCAATLGRSRGRSAWIPRSRTYGWRWTGIG